MRSILSTTATNWQLPLRLCLFFVFWMHGAQKVIGLYNGPGLQGFANYVASQGMPIALGYVAALAEFLGAWAMFFGFLTRIAALGLVANMAVATFSVHLHNGFFMNWALTPGKGHGYEYAMTLLLMAFTLLIGGAGNLSVDRKLASREQPQP